MRVGVFIDWANAYHRARDQYESFASSKPPPAYGSFWPTRLGEWLAANQELPERRARRRLVRVAVFRGIPHGRWDQGGLDAWKRQRAAWEQAADPRLIVRTHPLRYEFDLCKAQDMRCKQRCTLTEEPFVREKGIDVQMAIDVLGQALTNAVDVAVLVTADTDFLPLVSELENLRREGSGSISVELTAWQGVGTKLTPPPQVWGGWRHWITPDVFNTLRDDTDYDIA